VLDLGCGAGVLGICLGAANPGLRLELVDRNALALEFAALNCRAASSRFMVPCTLTAP